MTVRLYITVLFLICLTVHSVQAQNQNQEKWSQIDALLDDVKENLNDHPQRCKKLIDSCLRMSVQHNYLEGEGEAKKYLGNYYSLKGNHEQGRKNIVIGLRILERAGVPKINIAEGQLDIGNTWFREGKYDNAMRKYIDAMQSFEKYSDSARMLKGYANMSKVYLAREEYIKAEGYLTDMLNMAKEINIPKEVAHAYNLLGSLHQSKGDLEKAGFYFQNALEINLTIENPSGIAHGYNNMAILSYYEGDLDGAIAYFKRALDKRLEIKNPKHIAESYRNIGSVYFFEGQYEKSIQYFRESQQVAEKGNALKDVALAHRYISNAYENLNKADSALRYFQLFKYVEDSIARQDKDEMITDLEFKYQNEQLKRQNETLDHKQALHELKIEKLSKQKAHDQFKIIALSILFVLVLVFLGFIAYSLIVKSRLNRSLEKQKTVLEHKNEIIELKNKEILSSIAYAQNLQTSLLPPIDTFKDKLSEVALFFQPKDIVSGDFYWTYNTEKALYFAVGDCTGHGVPGAMLSVMSINILNTIVRQNPDIQTDALLRELNEEFTNYLYHSHQKRLDGLDITLCKYTPDNHKVEFSGAVNSLLAKVQNEFKEIKATRRSIGGMSSETLPFERKTVEVQKGDVLFLYTDGYQDQFGGKEGKKFRRQNFRKLVQKIAPFSYETQEQLLAETLAEWQGAYEQVDDILVLGVKI